jgi:hypothetical protein
MPVRAKPGLANVAEQWVMAHEAHRGSAVRSVNSTISSMGMSGRGCQSHGVVTQRS